MYIEVIEPNPPAPPHEEQQVIVKKGYSPYLDEEDGYWWEYNHETQSFVKTTVKGDATKSADAADAAAALATEAATTAAEKAQIAQDKATIATAAAEKAEQAVTTAETAAATATKAASKADTATATATTAAENANAAATEARAIGSTKVGYAEYTDDYLLLYADSTKAIEIARLYIAGGGGSGISETRCREIIEGYGYETTADLTTKLAAKQDTISDLPAIRSGAAAGATALQSDALTPYRTAAEQDAIHDSTKQDVLTDADKQAIADLHTDAVTSVNGETGAVTVALSGCTDDSTHRLVTDTEKAAWSAKADAPTVLTATLEAGATILGFHNSAISSTAIINLYTSVWGVSPTAVTQSGTTLTLTFAAQSADIEVKAVIS